MNPASAAPAAAGAGSPDAALAAERVRSAPPLLAAFNRAGVLAAVDVHVAATLGRLGGETGEQVLLATALAVRGPRLAHVCIDLADVRTTVTVDELDAGDAWWPGTRAEPLRAGGRGDGQRLGDPDRAVPGPGGAVPGPGGAVPGPGGDGGGPEPVDLDALPWPSPSAWREAVARSPLVRSPAAPLHLDGSLLYLDRYWRHEQRVLAALHRRATAPAAAVDDARLRAELERLFGATPPPATPTSPTSPTSPAASGPARRSEPDWPRVAAETAVRRRLTVVAGGPGTGKTTTAAKLLAVLRAQTPPDAPPPRVALAAPTGKAAARLTEAITEAAHTLPLDPRTRDWLAGLQATTLHRLLGRRPDSRSRFRHDAANPLPHDAVIVDETSMVSLSLMARLLDAVPDAARLVLLGDPDQLHSVEAGAVLGDIVGDVGDAAALDPAEAASPGEAGVEPPATARPAIAGSIVVLRRLRRYAGEAGMALLAAAVRRGDADAAVELLGSGREDLTWLAVEADAADEAIPSVRRAVTDTAAAVVAAADRGDAGAALRDLGRLRVLCAHRRGPAGVSTWVARAEGWLAAELGSSAVAWPWYPGRPVLVTRNDPQLGLANGDVGVVIVRDERGGAAAGAARGDRQAVAVAFPGGGGQDGGVRWVSPARLEAVQTVHAMTIHKSQGSQFAHVVVVLPAPDSRVLTRELLYTAVTRAQAGLTVVGAEASVRAAVARRVARASGLRRRLWEG